MGACVICDQQITNPLSPERLTEQISTWLAEVKPKLIKGLQIRTEQFLPMNHGDDFCVITGKKLDVCPYCYTEHIFNWLLTLKLEASLLAEYLLFFHYDGGRQGYYKSAEQLGILS